MSSEDGSHPSVIYALDFDGVLVDSASETGKSGLEAARILFKGDAWISQLVDDDNELAKVIDGFCQVRPCLETGWEASLLIKLLADPDEGKPSTEEILRDFQSILKPRILSKLNLDKETCNDALRTARNTWISKNNAKSWLDAHGFFQGACEAVETLLHKLGNQNVYIITTKAKDYARRLLEQQGLYKEDDSLIKESHIYGLGSGPKAQVLAEIIKSRDSKMAMMVEDNLKTLEKIMASDIQSQVLPVLASWGYNTQSQQETARQHHYVVLGDSSSLSQVLADEASVLQLWSGFQSKILTK